MNQQTKNTLMQRPCEFHHVFLCYQSLLSWSANADDSNEILQPKFRRRMWGML